MKRMRFVMILAVFVAALALLTSTAQAARIVGGYARIYEGIEYATGSDTSPRLMKAFAIRVSLRNPDVTMYASHGNGGLPYEVTRETTPRFLSDHGCKVAVNASFYDPNLSPNTNVLGLLVSLGELISYPDFAPFNSQLVFAYDKTAHLIVSDSMMGGIYNGVGGAEIILSNGSILGGVGDVHPRTGMGLSQDGKYLIMVVVDGRRAGWSDGATLYDLARWLFDFGAWNAANFDGGGSSCMVRADVGVVNRPSDGSPRAVASNLGAGSAPCGTVGPSVCSMNPNRLDMAIRGNMNQVVLKTWTSSSGWAAPVVLPGVYTYDTPAIVSRADGILNIFVRGTDNQLWYNYYDGSTWSAWYSLGGVLASGPYACSMNEDNLEIVYRGTDNAVWYLSWNSGVWTYGSLGGITYDRPAIVSRTPTTKNVFHRGTNNQLYYNYYDGSTWSAWYSLGGTLTSGPAVTSRNADNLEIVYRSTYDNLWYLSWNSGVWNYGNLGGVVAGVPAICSVTPDTATVYVRGSEDAQYHNAWLSGIGWVGFTWQGAYY